MGFPVGYAEVFFPNLFLHTLTLLGLLRNLVFLLFHFLGLSDFLETDVIWPDTTGATARTPETSKSPSVSALLIQELLPASKFGDLVGVEEGCCCAVCLFEFSEEEEIRCLRNCRHIFHRNCVDRWIDHDQKTCPLCRTPFVPDDMIDDFNQRLWAASGVTDFYGYEEEYASSF
ncbi:brassinosteroid-responsive RING protein 1-like [Cicer arietinum]|uniref:E3 ubiquitin-protein ligase RHA1B-like n=1 Tax=Cicer arietinum TaxID=3827 RepID=A0A1S2YVW6_CICAR|nr:E3 ubiquitin-protein ligase RHA1B-like [Cicer arietinum]